MKKFRLVFIWVVCLLVVFAPVMKFTTNVYAADDSAEEEDGEYTEEDDIDTTIDTNSQIGLTDNWETPVCTYGQTVNVVLPLVNLDKHMVTDVRVTPELSTDAESWPFEIEKSSYTMELTELLGSNNIADEMERRQEITYTFKTRKDITTGYQSLNFDVSFTDINGTRDSATVVVYVKTVGAPGSGGEEGSILTPRVIVSGFTTQPAEVQAGGNFTLTLHIQNTSSTTTIKNLQMDLQAVSDGKDDDTTAAAFLPVSGSSTIFADSISAGATKDVSIDMNAKADLSQKPYVLDISLAYQDASYNEYDSTASVSIPVKQKARYEIGSIDVMPESINVGSESDVMFSIYNTGKTQLYNVSVKFEGDSISGGDTYIGNIECGETGNVDTMISGAAPTEDDGTVKMLISYEDEAGNVTTDEQTINLYVTDASNDEVFDDFDDEMIDDTTSSGPNIFLILAIVVIVAIAAAVGVVLFLRIRKKRKEQSEDEAFIDNFDFAEDRGQTDLKESHKEEKQASELPKKEGGDDEIS